MPTLQFKGRNIIWNHHLAVPYHTLEHVEKLDYKPEQGQGNLIIEGDNLTALKALLPKYQGAIKCIYIDPPYNTGTETWIYNDRVNSPMIQEWFNQTVARDDLARHDKWLCMMTPRLKLLFELLHNDGVMFVSIGDGELGNLLCLMDNLFGDEFRVAIFSWKSRSKPTNAGNAKFRPQKVAEYVVAYSKKFPDDLLFNLYSGVERKYPKKDKDGNYRTTTILTSNMGMFKRETMRFSIAGFKPSEEQRWKAGEDEVKDLHKRNRLEFNEEGIPMWKKYEQDEDELLSPMYTFVDEDLSGTAEQGKSELSKLIGKDHGFDTVKPVGIIKYLIQITTTNEDVILDSFAGSGTTAQATLELNHDTNGNRKFILVQPTEATKEFPKKNICKDVAHKRVRAAINTYDYKSGFQYWRVGEALDAETMLAGKLPGFEDFAKHVFYLCTGRSLKDEKKMKPKEYFVGEEEGLVVYLIYENKKDALMHLALTWERAQQWHNAHKTKRVIVYAPACFISEEDLEVLHIEFVNIPYNLFERRK